MLSAGALSFDTIGRMKSNRRVCVLALYVTACASDVTSKDPPAPVYSSAAGAPACPAPVDCPPAPACPAAAAPACPACPLAPAAVDCPPAPACPAPVDCPAAPACPPAPDLAHEYALRPPFCRTQDGQLWGCETFTTTGAPAGNVTYTAGGVAWSCVLRTPDSTAPDGLGWAQRYTAPLACGVGAACDVTIVTSGGVEHHTGVCESQRELSVAQ